MNQTLQYEIEKTFEKIITTFTCENYNRFIQADPQQLDNYLIGLGTWIRTKILRPQRRIYKAFCENDIHDKYTMSKIVIAHLHQYLREHPQVNPFASEKCS